MQEIKHGLKGLRGSPSSWLQRFIGLLEPSDAVLDLACGCGRNSWYLASWGLNVTGVDVNGECARYIEEIPGARFLQADLENAPWPFEAESFDAVVVNFYLHRPLLPKIVEVVKKDGFIFYETFALPFAGFDGNRAKSPDFVLQPLELVDAFRGQCQILAYEQTLGENGDFFERVLARKGAQPLRLRL